MPFDERSSRSLFSSLLSSISEEGVAVVLAKMEASDSSAAWHPLGGNENNFGVIENQQSSPVAALIEKITNSIDATLMRHCYEASVDPKSEEAPRTMDEGIRRFFESSYQHWHLLPARKAQAESIQIVASGSTKHPCLLIYDDGEGQHPELFEQTFLSILRGNKNEIQFVQGKYNMGGTGAIVFCGKKRYQLVASKRYDGTGDFGFTLVRKHPLSEQESKTKKNTWYEFLKIDGQIPRFPIDELDVGLHNRKFKTGSLIKLFDYDLPAGTRGALPQEPRRAIDQFLFEPALPIYLVDSKDRYPNNNVLQIDCFGLKRRLEGENKYVEKTFSISSDEHDIGHLKITCYVFKAKIGKQTVKETKDNIQRDYFHDGMSVLFSLNGQVHGHYSSEFITLALKMQLLKHHLLIHVDCTGLNYNFRNELFMASRDRLKSGDETNILRKRVADILRKSELQEIYDQRKNAISVESGDAKDLLKAFSKNLPFNKDLMRLLNQTFKIEQEGDQKKENHPPAKPRVQKAKDPFKPQRYPSFFRLKKGDGDQLITIPQGDEKTVSFLTDVEDGYFDRVEDPGDLKVSILQRRANDTDGGTEKGPIDAPGSLIDIRKSSPKEGTIRIGFGSTKDLPVGEELEVLATLGGPEDHECRFWLKVVDPAPKPKDTKHDESEEPPPMGLPEYVLVYKERGDDQVAVRTWEEIGNSGIDMDWQVVMHPFVEEDQLKTVYINMDSSTLLNYKSRLANVGPEQVELSDKRFISSVYFHTIFLYSTTKGKKYEMKRDGQEADLQEYLKDVFSSSYSDFLLNFGMDQLIQSISD